MKNDTMINSMMSLAMPPPPPPPPYLSSPPGFDEHKNWEKSTSAATDNNTSASFLKKGDDPKFHQIEGNPVPLARTSKVLERVPSEDINESAEAFIKNFRQQLALQRLESLENYKKMLERGL